MVNIQVPKSARSTGKLWMESKEEMRARGVKLPDIADAFCMAFAIQSVIVHSYLPYDDSGRAEIARKRGWEYAGSEEDARAAMYAGDNDGGMSSGFGGVHGQW